MRNYAHALLHAAPAMEEALLPTVMAHPLVDYGDDDEEEDSGVRSSDDDLLVPRKRVRVQKSDAGELSSLNNAQLASGVSTHRSY